LQKLLRIIALIIRVATTEVAASGGAPARYDLPAHAAIDIADVPILMGGKLST
jgi:hypothetical protein